MRRLLLITITALLGVLLMGSGEVQPHPRACGGFTYRDAYPCCISGTVTLEGEAVAGASVTAYVAGVRKAGDITDHGEGGIPTFGIMLNGDQLQANPGEVVTIVARYKEWSRTFELTVQPGELWLDIELLSAAR